MRRMEFLSSIKPPSPIGLSFQRIFTHFSTYGIPNAAYGTSNAANGIPNGLSSLLAKSKISYVP